MSAIRLVFHAVVVLLCATSVDAAHCNGGQLEETDINSDILSYVNAERQKVRDGAQQNGPSGNPATLPAAKTMPDLSWDCNLETEAINILATANCPSFSLPSPPAYASLYSQDDYMDQTFPFVIQTFIGRIGQFSFDDVTTSEVKFSSGMLTEYATLIRASTTGIGCAKMNCVGKSNAILCLTNDP
ncbi:SCP-like protein [Oesophagostomum dentatum]|uniref:SCP-like protein n=1 Tax=Oesophagostomum dentatum TaxID=61180 RepID=A0A0B1TLW3_OESDE|nr:SCP-like protein [Oesophagostomum dentatum]